MSLYLDVDVKQTAVVTVNVEMVHVFVTLPSSDIGMVLCVTNFAALMIALGTVFAIMVPALVIKLTVAFRVNYVYAQAIGRLASAAVMESVIFLMKRPQSATAKGMGWKIVLGKGNISACGALNWSYPNGVCFNDTKLNALDASAPKSGLESNAKS